MQLEEMKVGELMQLVKALGGSTQKSVPASRGLTIVVCDRGFVYIGDTTTDAEFCTISNAKNLRIWGTTNGLGQLALQGPTKDTRLDKVGTVVVPMRAVINLISTEQSLWK